MKRSARIAISTATGVGMFFAAKGITETAPNYEQVNKPVVACAKQLGGTAVVSETVPEQCVGGEFKSVEHITRTYDPGVGYDEKTTSLEYSLPNKSTYLKENYVSQDEVAANRRLLDKVALSLSALFGLLMYPTTKNMFRTRSAQSIAHSGDEEQN